ncbi:hypothetical protein FA13DRAFT_1722309 [Coprinellus micaceus]|uniref:Uncharacterized protein n=1 Tax=Coprinellus micaceus TaxID=71717 RepID=A0A4Y7RMD9_COPMI|nr:hypothetical protein FA13DRAFT_1722309 [Coprinellus micaceus]
MNGNPNRQTYIFSGSVVCISFVVDSARESFKLVASRTMVNVKIRLLSRGLALKYLETLPGWAQLERVRHGGSQEHGRDGGDASEDEKGEEMRWRVGGWQRRRRCFGRSEDDEDGGDAEEVSRRVGGWQRRGRCGGGSEGEEDGGDTSEGEEDRGDV